MSRIDSPRTLSRATSNWPDLQHKYGKLGIAAVAAAVLPDNGGSRRRVTSSGEGQEPTPAKPR